MGTRSDLLLLLRREPGSTVSELATELHLTGMAVRRHLDALSAAGYVAADRPERKGVGRPASGWHLTDAGMEDLFPRRYDDLALDVLDDVAHSGGVDAVNGVFARQAHRLAARYRDELDGDLEKRVLRLAELRDEGGFLADVDADDDGELVLRQCNCAVHKVAACYPSVCEQELELMRGALGPGVQVSRVAHMLAGDAVCAYRISPAPDNA